MPKTQFLIVCLLLLAPRSVSADEPAPPSSSSDSTKSIRVILDGGRVVPVTKVGLSSLGWVRFTGIDGRDSTVSINSVKRVEDELEQDRTKELLDGHPVAVGDEGPVVEKDALPAPARERFWGVHGGALVPIGTTHDVTATGFTLQAGLDWRRKKSRTLGLRVEFSEFGGSSEVERALSDATNGSVDQLRYRMISASLTYRWLILPDRKAIPFVQLSIGPGTFTSILQGPAGEASDWKGTMNLDAGLGVNVRLTGKIGLDLLAAYTHASPGRTNVHLDGAHVVSSGNLHYLNLRLGFARRY